jgi:hypothetical protein
MTDTLTIDRIAVTSHDDAPGWADRVDRIVNRVADMRLEQSLRSRSLAAEGEWLIRRVVVTAALDSGRPDMSLEDALSSAVLDAIADAVANGDVVHYRRPVDGLADLVASAATRRFERVWAWARLGLIADLDGVRREPASCVLDALATRPDQALAAVSRAAAGVGLAPLHRLFGDAGWIRLADVVIGACLTGSTARCAGAMVRVGTVDMPVDVGPGEAVPGIFITETPRARRPVADAGAIRQASRLVGSSAIAAAARGSRLRLMGPTARALAVLVVAESEPAALARAGGLPLCRTVAAMLAGAAQPIPETPHPPADFGAARQTRNGSAEPSADGIAADAQDATEQPDEPGGEHTDRAGLLYLINAAADAAMPDLLFTDPVLEGIPGSELLARVALRLVSAADDDPAVLAFAGLDARRVRRGWSRARLPAGAQRRIDAHARAWAQAVAARLRRDDEPAVVVAGVTKRPGRIELEPGWVDVHLALADVDVDVRCAGLDLDPGWVPWLGCVVRFRYV